MQELQINRTMTSREISEITGKRHSHVLRDVDILNLSYVTIGLPKVGEGYYTHPNTGNQKHREMILSRLQILDLVTGYSTDLRIKVVRRLDELENGVSKVTKLDLARMVIESELEKEKLQLEINENAPLVSFAKALQVSEDNVLIGELAKVLKQNDIEIGQNRLFDWLRDNQYLIKSGQQKNLPTQRSLDLKIFFLKITPVNLANGTVIMGRTTTVTPKGQMYFVNKFLKQ